MIKTIFRVLAPAAALAVLLTACGGGDDEGIFVDEKDPSASGLSASVTVVSPGNATLSGIYSTNNVLLNNVTKQNPIGGDPELCKFRFAGLQQQGSTGTTRTMDGDVRYIPGTSQVRSGLVSINTIEFTLPGTTGVGATVDKANNQIVFTNAQFTSRTTGQAITLNGAVPLLRDRPEGC